MSGLARFIGQPFDKETNTCWDFARTVILDARGVDIGDRKPVDRTQWAGAFAKGRRQFRQVDEPQHLGLALLRQKNVSHVAVTLNEYGSTRLLHVMDGHLSRCDCLSLYKRVFPEILFYDCQTIRH
jgi:hypothetical protein